MYYLSKKMIGYELNYTLLEKTRWALVWTTKRLHHYMLSHHIRLTSRMDLIKYLFEKPALVGRMAKWLLLLAEFELKFVTRKSVKERAVAEFLADFPIQGAEDQEFEFPDEELMQTTEDVWQLYFDGASN